MITDLTELRAAWPEGFCDVRGVLTLGGAVMLGAGGVFNAKHRISDVPDVFTANSTSDVVLRGDLLPEANRDDPSWDLLLRDLAKAAWPGERQLDRIGLRGTGSAWVVHAAFPGQKGSFHGAQVLVGIEPTDDPELALVRMRAALRKEG